MLLALLRVWSNAGLAASFLRLRADTATYLPPAEGPSQAVGEGLHKDNELKRDPTSHPQSASALHCTED